MSVADTVRPLALWVSCALSHLGAAPVCAGWEQRQHCWKLTVMMCGQSWAQERKQNRAAPRVPQCALLALKGRPLCCVALQAHGGGGSHPQTTVLILARGLLVDPCGGICSAVLLRVAGQPRAELWGGAWGAQLQPWCAFQCPKAVGSPQVPTGRSVLRPGHTAAGGACSAHPRGIISLHHADTGLCSPAGLLFCG